MTNYEYIKQMPLEELAVYLCDLATASGCDLCPASKYCYNGHNGYPDYLKEEHKDET